MQILRESMGTVEQKITDSLSSVVARLSVCEGELKSRSPVSTPTPTPTKKSWFSRNKHTPSPVPSITQPPTSGNSDPAADFLLKFVIVGDTGVGKSQIVSQFTKQQFSLHARPTAGVKYGTKTIQVHNHKATLQLWDTSGAECYRPITLAHYRNVIGALAVYDVTSSVSFASIGGWLEGLREKARPHCVMVIVGNKTDCDELRVVSFQEEKSFADREHLLFIETSANDAANISQVFELLSAEVIRVYEKGAFT
jgi:Ras-related protein Rab-11A